MGNFCHFMRTFKQITAVGVVAASVGCGAPPAADPTTDAAATETAQDTSAQDTAVAQDSAVAQDTAVADTPGTDIATVDAPDAGATDAAVVDVPDVAAGDVAAEEVAGDVLYPDTPDVTVAPGLLPGPSKGSAVALSPDDSIAVVCNRDTGSISVFSLTYTAGAAALAKKVGDVSLGAGSEPWQAVVAPDGDSVWVVLRRDQKLVKVTGLKTTPVKGAEVTVGSEPTSVALSPSGKVALVSNFSDGTVSVVLTAAATVVTVVDLNAALVATGSLGAIKSRPALAHPRSIAITNDGDADDNDEIALVTEFFAQRTAPEAADGANADVNKRGIVYRIAFDPAGGPPKATVIDLPPLADIGFKDQANGGAGCFPNQLQSVAVNGKFAYVASICASPKGPIGPFAGPAAAVCAADAECPGAVAGSCASLKCKTNCKADTDCGANGGKCTAHVCEVNTAGVKTAIANVVSVIDLGTAKEIGAFNLNALFRTYYDDKKVPDDNGRRYPLVMTDIGFVTGTNIGYVTANGADAVFRFKVDPNGKDVVEVGSAQQHFIDLAHPNYDAKLGGRGPVGLAIPVTGKKFAFVANEFTRNLTVVDFNTQEIAGGPSAPSVVATAALPAAGSEDEAALKGKRFFNTGLGRWSLKGQAWNACQTCHVDGLSDNVTWYFARGPRQSTSLDGSYASKDHTNQRIFNWTAVFDEMADFENNTRGVSGGVGAIVSKATPPIGPGDRIDIAGLGHGGLNGSAGAAADPKSGVVTPPSVLTDWAEIAKYVQGLRSPRKPSNLDENKVAEGKTVYLDANCQGCHSGPKWTISTRFFKPSVAVNTALKTKAWAPPQYFPKALLPAITAANQLMRFGGANPAAFDQIQCIVRPVGTFNVAEAGVGVAELRADMKTKGQGEEVDGNGFNPPSLLNVVAGAPFLHAGNARSLEGLFSATFKVHYNALAANFLEETDPAKKAAIIDNLVQFLLSIDEDTAVTPVPKTADGKGGDFCAP